MELIMEIKQEKKKKKEKHEEISLELKKKITLFLLNCTSLDLLIE